MATDPSDAVSAALCQLAKRPARRNVVYNLARPVRGTPPALDDLRAFGLELARVPYAEFRQVRQASAKQN